MPHTLIDGGHWLVCACVLVCIGICVMVMYVCVCVCSVLYCTFTIQTVVAWVACVSSVINGLREHVHCILFDSKNASKGRGLHCLW